MYLYVHGFLPDDDEDDPLRFKLKIDKSFTEQLTPRLGQQIDAMTEGERPLTAEQVQRSR